MDLYSTKESSKVVEEEKVLETADVQKTMGSMITLDGATLLFPTSFGYFDPHVLKVATQYPKVTFLHAGGLYQEGKHPKNVGSYFGYIDEAQYLAGIVAGHTSRSGKLGFVNHRQLKQAACCWRCQRHPEVSRDNPQR